jgi:hypothetical protein
MLNNIKKNHVVYEVKLQKCGRTRQVMGDNIIWCAHMACWITKATDTRSK